MIEKVKMYRNFQEVVGSDLRRSERNKEQKKVYQAPTVSLYMQQAKYDLLTVSHVVFALFTSFSLTIQLFLVPFHQHNFSFCLMYLL